MKPNQKPVQIDFIWDSDCPNAEAARQNLEAAIAATDIWTDVREWRTGDPNTPEKYRRYGSPTILIEGRDLLGKNGSGEHRCCRLYPSGDGGLATAPSTEYICSKLESESIEP